MIKNLIICAAVFAVMIVVADPAHAATTFNTIAGNMVSSISQLPTLLSAIAYLFGLILCVLGILKIKDHVENPGQTPLKDGAIRLAAGGGLFALPIIYSAAKSTIGSGGSTGQASLTGLSFP